MKNIFFQKYHFLLYVLLIWGIESLAQNQIGFSYIPCINCTANNAEDDPFTLTFQYGGVTNFETNHMVSDFGPRYPNDYDWHNGVDFSAEAGDADFGDKILSISAGRVARIEALGSYNLIMVDGDNGRDYAYGHIFRGNVQHGSNLGNMVWVVRGGGLGIAIVFVGENRAIGVQGGTVTYQGTTYTVQTHVNADEAIAPVGDSGGNNGNYAAHVHLYEIPAVDPPNVNWGSGSHALLLNPLSHINHSIPEHSQVLCHPGDAYLPPTPGILLSYDDDPTSIRTRDSYTGTNGALFVPDVNKVQFFIKANGSASYGLIRGNSYIGEVKYGGSTADNNKYPVDSDLARSNILSNNHQECHKDWYPSAV